MGRIRSIKPEFATSPTIGALSIPTRLHFAMLWTAADDAGRARDDPRWLKGQLWPYDDDISAASVDEMQQELAEAGLIERYEVAGDRLFSIANWDEHQHPRRPLPSKFPPRAPDGDIPRTQRAPDGDIPRAQRAPDGDIPRAQRAPDGDIYAHMVCGQSAPDARRERRGEEGRGGENTTHHPRDNAALVPVSSAPLTVVDDFPAFWAVYPRKVGKRTAEQAWRAALKRATSGQIVAGLDRMLPDFRARPPDKIPHAATWLNRDGWLDEPQATPRVSPSLQAVIDVAHARECAQ